MYSSLARRGELDFVPIFLFHKGRKGSRASHTKQQKMGNSLSCLSPPAPGATTASKPKTAAGDAVNAVVTSVTAAVQHAIEEAKQVLTGDKIPIGSAVQTPYGVGVLDAIRSDGVAVVTLDFFAKAYLQLNQITALPKLPEVGSRVTTVYGDGKLEEVRKEDGCAIVAFDFGGKGYLRPDQIRPVRAKPFVPASFWTSGIYAEKIVPAIASLKRTQEDKGEEKAVPAAADEEKVDAPVTTTTSSKKKKKSKN